jgi:hypothetical protein
MAVVTEARTARLPDLHSFDERPTDGERAVRDRVRAWCDAEVTPVINDYEGTHAIQSLIVGREITGTSAFG